MKILGIDPSTQTGVALLVCSGSADFYLYQVSDSFVVSSKSKDRIVRALDIASFVGNMCLEDEIDLAVIEGYGYGNHHTLATLVEIGFAIRCEVVRSRGVALVEVSPTSLKKFVTGRGNAKKSEMLSHLWKTWGIGLDDHNVGDAAGLALIGAGLLKFLPRLGLVQQEVLEVIRRADNQWLQLVA
jgi:Holliday junction resolvasome RuvABC endonuclease subunit